MSNHLYQNIPLRQKLAAASTVPHATITRPMSRSHILPVHQHPNKPSSSHDASAREKNPPAKRRRNATAELNQASSVGQSCLSQHTIIAREKPPARTNNLPSACPRNP